MKKLNIIITTAFFTFGALQIFAQAGSLAGLLDLVENVDGA